MRVGKADYKILTPISNQAETELLQIEHAARVCYDSVEKADHEFIRRLITNCHESPLEHSLLSVEFNCDRAIANELTRHRLASFNQESTRYVNYGKEKYPGGVTFIPPGDLKRGTTAYSLWEINCFAAETAYLNLLKEGCTPQTARSVLPQCTATRLVVSANYREWRHIFKLRTGKGAHPDMIRLLKPLLHDLKVMIPVIFDDIEEEETK